MVLFEEWHLELHVPPELPDDVAEHLRRDFDAAVRQVADDLTARVPPNARRPLDGAGVAVGGTIRSEGTQVKTQRV